jgi:glyoxylase-like metal-dependent hydrolase (beta-lactamase superfamily II)
MKIAPRFAAALLVFSLGLSHAGMADEPAVASACVPRESSWFKATQVAPGTWCIDDHGTSNVYLAIGTEKALVIDTGSGAADLRGYLESITSLPLIVLNTHWHPDHVGADYQFDEVLITAVDAGLLEKMKPPFSAEFLAGMGLPAVPEIDKYKGPLHAFTTREVKDGDFIDLGGRRIEVIATPGHTPGEIVLLDGASRILFAGDNNNGLVWLQLPGTQPLTTFLDSLRKLEKRVPEFSMLLPGHGGPSDGARVAEQIRCVETILDGSATSEFYHAGPGDGRVSTYGNVSVVFDPENLR